MLGGLRIVILLQLSVGCACYIVYYSSCRTNEVPDDDAAAALGRTKT